MKGSERFNKNSLDRAMRLLNEGKTLEALPSICECGLGIPTSQDKAEYWRYMAKAEQLINQRKQLISGLLTWMLIQIRRIKEPCEPFDTFDMSVVYLATSNDAIVSLEQTPLGEDSYTLEFGIKRHNADAIHLKCIMTDTLNAVIDYLSNDDHMPEIYAVYQELSALVDEDCINKGIQDQPLEGKNDENDPWQNFRGATFIDSYEDDKYPEDDYFDYLELEDPQCVDSSHSPETLSGFQEIDNDELCF